MASLNSLLFFVSFSFFIVYASSLNEQRSLGRRALLSFKESRKGGNVTFDCSPSGPCIPCAYSEKSDEKYRCSETGYRIPFKCVEIRQSSKSANVQDSDVGVSLSSEDSIKHRTLLEDSSTSKSGSLAYVTYRSCIPAVNEEKVSVLGFEGTVLCLMLVSGAFVYFRRKKTLGGAGRIQASSRF